MGRTARMASSGSGLAFIMPEEIKYVSHLRKKYGFDLYLKNKFKLGKVFENEHRIRCGGEDHYNFKTLKNIEDPDEK